MAKVQDVAAFFIDLAQKQNAAGAGDLMTNLRLQKLLYFAQGWHLARYGKPLFDDNLCAWQYGPVVPSIYHKYKSCGNSGITEKHSLLSSAFTQQEYDLLLDVASEYDTLSTAELVRRSHASNAPWASTQQSTTIPQNEIHAYFAGQHPLLSFDDLLDGYPVEVL